MSLEATYHVDATGLPVVPTAAAVPSVSVELDRVLILGDDPPVLLLSIDRTPDALATAFDEDQTVLEWEVLQAGDTESLYRVVVGEQFRDLKRLLLDAGGVPSGATITPSGWRATACFPDRDAISAFRNACTDAGASFRIERLAAADGTDPDRSPDVLTDAQRTALALALDGGYFDSPKRVSLAELAAELGLSTSAVSSRIRRAQRRLAAQAIDDTYKHPDRSTSR